MITIQNVEDIKEYNVEYNTVSNGSNRYFKINKDEEGFYIYGHVCGQMTHSVCIGEYIKYWKTWNGVIRAIKRFAKDGSWGFQNFFPNEYNSR